MKSGHLITLCILLFGLNSSAQFVGGGSEETLKNSKPINTSPWKNRFYLYAGPSNPIGVWNRDADPDGSITSAYTNNTGFGAKNGFMFQMGNMFFLKRLALPENMGIAINATYINFSYNKFDWTPVMNGQGYSKTNFFFFGTKIGAQYTYSLMANMCVDAYFNLCPTAAVLGSADNYAYTSNTNYRWSATPSAGWGTRKNFGVNFRYQVLTVGLDFMTGAVRSTLFYEVYDNKTKTYINDEIYAIRFRPNSMQLRFGFTF